MRHGFVGNAGTGFGRREEDGFMSLEFIIIVMSSFHPLPTILKLVSCSIEVPEEEDQL